MLDEDLLEFRRNFADKSRAELNDDLVGLREDRTALETRLERTLLALRNKVAKAQGLAEDKAAEVIRKWLGKAAKSGEPTLNPPDEFWILAASALMPTAWSWVYQEIGHQADVDGADIFTERNRKLHLRKLDRATNEINRRESELDLRGTNARAQEAENARLELEDKTKGAADGTGG